MKDFLKDIKDETLNGLRDSGNQRTNEAFIDGYNQAANICVGIITQKIDELHSQISESFLSEREQFILLKLTELKSETEEELRDFWSSNG